MLSSLVRQVVNPRFSRFADDLRWWTDAAEAQRSRKAPPY
jgi:hypothetical protein